jgi:hypothetical protein
MITAGYLSALTNEQFSDLLKLIDNEIDQRMKMEENKTLV